MMPAVNEPRFTIGAQFKTRGKYPRLCTVIEVLRTFDSENRLVRVRYVATHDLAGHTVTDFDVCDTTIAMGRGHEQQ